MREVQRLAYLNALGITQYVPLAPIAGALLLPEQDDAEDDMPAEATVMTAPANNVDTAPVPAPQETRSDLAETSIPLLDLNRVKPPRAVAPVVPRPATGVRFALQVLTLPAVRLVLELGQADAPGLSAREHRLVADLLLALDASVELTDGALKTFRWPLVNNPRIVADAGAARDALIAFLAATQPQPPVPVTLFLGTVAASCLHPASPGSHFQVPECGGECRVTHSLDELLRDWTCKPRVWQHLQALR